MTIPEAAVTTEGETSSNIAEMIEELTRPEGSKVFKISTEAVPVNTTTVAGESSQPGDLPEDLPSPNPQPGKIPKFDVLALSIVTDTVVMTARDVAPAQTEEPIIDTGAEDISVEASTEKAFAVKDVLEVAI